MLILTRKVGDSIKIGDDITIMLVGSGRNQNQVKLGIEAPANTPVHREEIYQKILQENNVARLDDIVNIKEYNHE